MARLVLLVFLAGFAGLSGLAAHVRLDAAAMARMDDAEFAAQASRSPPPMVSASWYEAVADRAVRMAEPDAGIAISALSEAVAIEPRDPELWTRLAHAHILAGPEHRDDAIAALDVSFRLRPRAGREFRRWRLTLVDSIWVDVPESIREKAIAEARVEPIYWSDGNIPQIASGL